jgi:Xaa-Pro dipeptidase
MQSYSENFCNLEHIFLNLKMNLSNKPLDLSELINRTRGLAEILGKNELDAAIISGNANVYYYTGTIQNGIFIIGSNGNPALLVFKSYQRALNECRLNHIIQISDLAKLISEIIAVMGSDSIAIGIEADILPVKIFNKLRDRLPRCKFRDASNLLAKNRMKKSDYEISCIKKAGIQVQALFEHLKSIIKPGITENDISIEAEFFLRQAGHQGYVRTHGFNQETYFGVISAGDSANAPSNSIGPTGNFGLHPSSAFTSSKKVLSKNETVIIDFVGAFNGYLFDATRIFFLGACPPKIRTAHDRCLKYQEIIADNLRPTKIPSDIYRKIYRKVKQDGFQVNFMGYGENKVQYLGHGVGLEINELPIISPDFNDPLEEGMVLAVEPKKYFKGIGAVGVENTFLVTRAGGQKLINYPDDIICIR